MQACLRKIMQSLFDFVLNIVIAESQNPGGTDYSSLIALNTDSQKVAIEAWIAPKVGKFLIVEFT